MTETVKIDAPKEIVDALNKHGADIESIIKDALTREAEEADHKELKKLAEEAKKILQKVPDDAIVKTIRNSRDQR